MSLPAGHVPETEMKTISQEVIDVDHEVIDTVEMPLASQNTNIKYGPPIKQRETKEAKVQYCSQFG